MLEFPDGILRAAEKCNGSGDCRKYALAGGTMCPSYMATRDEKNVTRARANIVRMGIAGKYCEPHRGENRERNTVKLSIVAPVYNEEDNVEMFLKSLLESLNGLQEDFEIILVNDGSNDQSLNKMLAMIAENQSIRVLDLCRNSGQTAAMMAGIDNASGDIIVTIDSDLQNDPADIPLLLAKLNEGFDVVSGWRQKRQDAPISRNFVSRIANKLISAISGVKLNDYGCTLKAYRRDILGQVKLYGEMHRFIPIYATWVGARVAEIPVNHRARIHGESKYGLERIMKVLLDMMVIKFLDKYFTKPIYVYGAFGFASIGLSFLVGTWILYLKFWQGESMIHTPLPLLMVTTFMIGILSLLMGLLGEITVRTYFESQQKPVYLIRKRYNFSGSSKCAE
jgi:dolichol-phosphate mannosyltransferase